MNGMIRPRRGSRGEYTFVKVRSPTEAYRALVQMMDIAHDSKGYVSSSLMILLTRQVLHMLMEHGDLRQEYSSRRTIFNADVIEMDDRREDQYSLGVVVSLGSAWSEDAAFEETPRRRYREECIPIWRDVSDDPRERGKRYFK